MAKVLLAGASGHVGREVLAKLLAKGHAVRTLSRSKARAEMLRDTGCEVVLGDVSKGDGVKEATEGVEYVVSCLGASVGLSLSERRGYQAVDLPAHEQLVAAAQKAGVPRMVYLGVFESPGYDHTRYVTAHREVDRLLDASGFSVTTVRPVGVFGALDPFLDAAVRGVSFVVGDGSAETNPIHPRDVAEQLVAHLTDGPRFVDAGGPEVMTRRAIAELPFRVLKKSPTIVSVPPAVLRAQSAMLRYLHPRVSDLMEFVAAVSTSRGVAPTVGKERLEDWFVTRGRAMGRVPPPA